MFTDLRYLRLEFWEGVAFRRTGKELRSAWPDMHRNHATLEGLELVLKDDDGGILDTVICR
jgi:hypothetical protein